MKTLFKTRATHVGGCRDGHVQSDDGLIDIDTQLPRENQLTDDKYSNAQQLFAAGYATSFADSLDVVAKLRGLEDLGDYSVTATIAYKHEEDGNYMEAVLDAYLPTLKRAKAEELVNAAHKVCPFSKATRDNITVTLNLLLD